MSLVDAEEQGDFSVAASFLGDREMTQVSMGETSARSPSPSSEEGSPAVKRRLPRPPPAAKSRQKKGRVGRA